MFLNSTHGPHRPHRPHFRLPLPEVKIEIRRGQAQHRIRPVPGPVFLVGTGRDCDMVLGDRQFPDVHFYLFIDHGTVSLRHLGGGPDVTVNGHVATATRLLDGDRIRTGPYEFLLRVGSAEDDAPHSRKHFHTTSVTD